MDLEQILFNYALKLLALRDHTTAELTAKLTRKIQKLSVGSAEDVKKMISRLKEHHFLDDQRYVDHFLNDQLRRQPQGTRMLRARLQKKGVSRALVNEILSAKNIDDAEQAEIAAQKKLGTLTRSPADKRKEKLFRFLSSRGFSAQTILKILDELI